MDGCAHTPAAAKRLAFGGSSGTGANGPHCHQAESRSNLLPDVQDGNRVRRQR